MNRTSKKPNFLPEKSLASVGKYLVVLVFLLAFLEGLTQDLEKENSGMQGRTKTFEVLVFLGTDCPISQDYIGALNKINSRFGNVKGLVPENISKKQLQTFQDEYQVAFPLELDKDHELVKKFSITVTPEVVLLDATGKVQYRGAIDNWYYELGKHRQTITEHYLIDAIQSSISGETIAIKEAKPIGCILSMHH